MKNEYIIIKTTFDSKENAKKLAKILVETKISACVQISEILSFYVWQEKTQEDCEFLLEIKTKEQNFDKIEEIIIKNHNYDVPQIFCLKIDKISEKYRNYLDEIIS